MAADAVNGLARHPGAPEDLLREMEALAASLAPVDAPTLIALVE